MKQALKQGQCFGSYEDAEKLLLKCILPFLCSKMLVN